MIRHSSLLSERISHRLKIDTTYLFLAIVLVGFVLRLRQYLANLSLWRDEASLALNILERSFVGLMHPLDDNQGAPLGFLWIQKTIVNLFGSSEYALRLFPFVSSVISLFLFWFIASRILNKRATFFALTLFAISDLLIEFSSEVKQYSSDVLIGLLALIILFLIKQNLNYVSAISYGLLGAALIWMSHPAIFFLAAVGASAAYSCHLKRNYERIKYLTLMGSLWIGSFLIFYVTSLTNLSANQYLLEVWRDGFPPSLAKPLTVLKWTIGSFLEIFEYPGGFSVFGLGALLYVIGAMSLYRRDKVIFAGLSLPILFTLFASFLGKYPFDDRLILFMTPLLLVPVAAGLEQLLKLLSASQFRLAGLILVVIIFFQPVVEAVDYLSEPMLKEEIRPVIEHIRDNWQEGDVIYVYYGALKPFEYYRPRYGFQDSDYIVGIESRHEWINYLPDLNQLHEHQRVWLLFSHVHSGNGVNEEHLLVKWLERTGGDQKDWFPRAGAAAYLYEF